MAEVETVKRCIICGKIISDLSRYGTSWQRHIRVKYCADCKPKSDYKRKSNQNRAKKISELLSELQFKDAEIQRLKRELAACRRKRKGESS